MKKTRVGLVGCGGFGNFHVDHLLQMEDVELAAVVSSDPCKISRMREKVPSVRGYETAEELFVGESRLDAVLICVPPACHNGVELLAAEHGVNLFVEKPVGLDLVQAEQAEKAIRASGIISCVGYQGRYNPFVDELKSVLNGRKVGTVCGRFLCGRPEVAWWSDPMLSGGQIVEQSTHLFDFLRDLFGEAKTVFSQQNPRPDADSSITTVSFDSGVLAAVTTGCYLQPDRVRHDVALTLYADDLQVEFDWDRFIRYTDLKETLTRPFTQDHHFVCLRTFIEAVQTGKREAIRSDYADGLKTLRLTVAANESLRTGKMICI